MKWLENKIVSVVWTVLRILLGIQWGNASWHKVTNGFDAERYIQGAIAKAAGDQPIVQGW